MIDTKPRKFYMLMEIVGDGPKINDADSWLCPWEDWYHQLGQMLEDMDDPNQIVNVRFTQMEFTDDELAEYCAENDIEWEG